MLWHVLFFSLLSVLFVPGPSAQETERPWGFRARAVISGSSHDSEPTGYKVYSGGALNAAVIRSLGDQFSAELSFHTESREVEGPDTSEVSRNRGSIEMTLLSVLVRWQPRGSPPAVLGRRRELHRNVGEERGAGLLELGSPSGPTPQVGSDLVFSSTVLLNLDVKWPSLWVEVEEFVPTPPTVQIDPLVFGLGLGSRF